MSDWPQPVPQRIGDAERDRAADFLREHHAQGRIDAAEFDERVTAALGARWQSDLDRLFVDLPAPKPQAPTAQPPASQAPPPAFPSATPVHRPAAVPARQQASQALAIAASVVWPIAILTMLVTRGEAWFMIVVAIAVTSLWHRRRQL